MNFVSIMLDNTATFRPLLSGLLAGSRLFSASQRKAHVLGRDLDGAFHLDRRGRARGSLLRPSSLVAVGLPGLSRLVMAIIAHGSVMVESSGPTLNRYS